MTQAGCLSAMSSSWPPAIKLDNALPLCCSLVIGASKCRINTGFAMGLIDRDVAATSLLGRSGFRRSESCSCFCTICNLLSGQSFNILVGVISYRLRQLTCPGRTER